MAPQVFAIILYSLAYWLVSVADAETLDYVLSDADGYGGRIKYVGGYEYRYPTEFQNHICGKCEDTECWGAQGISKHSNYITRSFYEKGTGTECNNKDATHVVISVMKRGLAIAPYNHILVETPQASKRECHAGDHVVRKIDEVHWFFIACTSHVLIFSETTIAKVSPKTMKGVAFKWFVNSNDVTRLEDYPRVSFSWISRVHQVEHEFYSGKYYKETSPDTEDLGMKRLQLKRNLNPSGLWNMTVVATVQIQGSEAKAKKAQGATAIGGKMYFVTSSHINRCDIVNETSDKPTIGNCKEACMIPATACPGVTCSLTSTVNECAERLVLQGAETDTNNDLYVGSEFDCDGKPFFEINNILENTKKGEPCFGSAVDQDVTLSTGIVAKGTKLVKPNSALFSLVLLLALGASRVQ